MQQKSPLGWQVLFCLHNGQNGIQVVLAAGDFFGQKIEKGSSIHHSSGQNVVYTVCSQVDRLSHGRNTS